MRTTTFLLCCTIAHASFAAASELTALEIVQRASQHDTDHIELRRQYTFRESIRSKIANKKGQPRREEVKVNDVFFVAGEEFRRLVMKDGRPLSETEAAKEQARFDKAIAKHKREDPSAAKKRQEKELRKEREFRQQVVEGFDFTLAGEDSVAGRRCFRIHAEPKAGFQPKGEGKILKKLRGDLWIDKLNFEWAQVHVESVDTISAMGGLLRLAQGAQLEVRQTYVNDEVWFPEHLRFLGSGRAMLFLSGEFDVEVDYSDFRKYSVDSTVSVAEHREP